MVRTRFAPSPTGMLHVGSVRTALFSWLYAKHCGGEFILRVEDTDKERSTQEATEVILASLAWLGLTHDEGPFYQSDRLSRYRELADQLLSEGKAYRCNCSKERLESLRQAQMAAHVKPRYDGYCRDKEMSDINQAHVIRFKNPNDGYVVFNDLVYGQIQVNNNELDDLIIVRSDGFPTYNFAVVIDDWDMGITHVIRGDDHINNTPRQINLFKAFDAPIPEFAHLSMILGDDGKKLSKRHGAVSVLQFIDLGILPQALLNYIVRLGWSYGDQEIFSLTEMIEKFDLKKINRGAASFNYDKLYWLNQHYQKNVPVIEVACALAWHFAKLGINPNTGPELTALVPLQAERCKTLAEICEKSLYFYSDDIEYNEDALKKNLRPISLTPLVTLYENFQQLSSWKTDELQAIINKVSAGLNIHLGKVAQPLRVAVTGNSNSPPIDSTLALLGKERTLSRLKKAIEYIKKRAENKES